MTQPDHSVLDIDNSSTDSNGESYYAGNAVGGHFFANTLTTFFTPDTTYTGYAANGYYYTSGVIDNSNRATWALEGVTPPDSSTRSDQDSMPDEVFVLYSETEVTIIDAVSLDMWMKFNISLLSGLSSTKIIKAKYAAGILCVLFQQEDEDDTPGGLLIFNFRHDSINYIDNSTYELRKGIDLRNNATSFGSHPNDTTFAPTDSFQSGQLYDLDVNYVGNQVKAIVGGLGFLMGFDLEALVVDTDYKASEIKHHPQTMSLVISSVNFAIADLVQEASGITSEWIMTDATNNLAILGVKFGDVLKVSAGGYTSYFSLNEIPSSGQASFKLKTVQSGFLALSKDIPGWKNDADDYLDCQTALETTNTYDVLRPVPFVRILSNGKYLLSSSFEAIHYSSSTSIIDASSSAEYDLFDEDGCRVYNYSSKTLEGFVGITSNLENAFLLFNDEIMKASMESLEDSGSFSKLTNLSEIEGSLSTTTNLVTLGNNIVLEPLSGNLFLGGLKSSDNYSYIVEVSTQGVTIDCTPFKIPYIDSEPDGIYDTIDTGASAEVPIIMDGYSNPNGTEV